MKFQLKYELVVMDDDGNILADVAANANIANLDGLVSAVTNAVNGAKSAIADKVADDIFSTLTKQ